MSKFAKMRAIFISLFVALLLADGALATYLLWPGTNPASRKAEKERLEGEEVARKRDALPLEEVDKKLVDTRGDIKKFYGERVPAYWSEISSELHKLEQANGIAEQSIKYTAEDAGLPNLQRVKIETSIASDYVKIAHFINALERDKYPFLINQIAVAGQPTGTVQLTIKFQTFLRPS